jgi:hypothetical protein
MRVSVFSVEIKLRYNNCNNVFFAYNAKKTKDSLTSERQEAHASLLLYISYKNFLSSGRRTANASLLLYISHKNLLSSGRHAVNASLLLCISHKTRRPGVPAV